MKTYKIEVYGRVQGVNFRAMTRKFCEEIGLAGEVRNKEDGSVEILVQCDNKGLKKLVGWIKGNPGFSRVDRVEIGEISIKREFEGFNVVRESFLKDQRKAFVNLVRS